MKYRVKEVNSVYYPQFRFCLIWVYFYDNDYRVYYYNLRDALAFINVKINYRNDRNGKIPKYHEVD